MKEYKFNYEFNYKVKDTFSKQNWPEVNKWLNEHFHDGKYRTWSWGYDHANKHDSAPYFWFIQECDAMFFVLKWC